MEKDFLSSIIKNIGTNYDENELAYLAMTSKIEGQLRDKIAFIIQKDNNFSVAREWERHDMVVFSNQKKVVDTVIEFKAHSGFRNLQEFVDDMYCDLAKCAHNKKIPKETNIYFVFFCYVFGSMPTNTSSLSYKETVKYKGFTKQIESLKMNPINYEQQQDCLHKEFSDLVINPYTEQTSWHTIDCGNYCGIELKIETALVGPLKKELIANNIETMSEKIKTSKKKGRYARIAPPKK